MAQRAADQITLTDLTDGVSVVMSSESYNFPGTTTAAIAGSTSTKIQALMGGDYVAASVNPANIVKPAGVSVTSDNHATAPTLTISVTTAVTAGGEVIIPVVVEGLTIEKRFSFGIAYKGETGAGGAKGDTGPTGPTGPAGAASTLVGLKNEAQMVVTTAAGATVAASTVQVDFFGYVGANRAAVTAAVGTLPAGITVATNTAGTTSADGVLTLSIANGSTLGGTDQGTIPITLTCNGISRVAVFSWSKAKQGAQGAQGNTGATGAAAVTVEVSSSNGLIFKNTQIATVLTARVYQGGAEVTGAALTALGTIRWYKDGGATAVGTGTTLTVSAGDVADRATFEARLEF
ncbi:hypothetical protein [Microbacterium arborescens]|uniref:hypothetical protein n=1 Tax=Microbacterium arborescens TaxID=33883 RepID=UPI000DF84B62|nr:hypothetical protein [Microbacterium arborescens]